MNNVLVTIGMPVYNGERFLEMAVKSILNQSFTNFELIIAEDGSTDRTFEILKSFNDDRIIIIRDGQNRGVSCRLNQITAIARGKYFARMDADDVMFPDRIKIQIDELEKHDIDVVHYDAVSINNSGNVIGYKFSKPVKSRDNIMEGLLPINPTVMAKTSILKNNPYKEHYNQMEDLELWYRIIDQYVFKNINVPVLFYREDSTPTSIKHKKIIRNYKFFTDEFNFSFMQRNYIIFIAWIKYVSFSLFEIGNMEELLLKRRYTSLSDSDIDKYNEIFNLIANQ